ncbi:MAG: response regulator [Salibacteraceae bacterium]
MTKIYIADDHQIFIDGIISILHDVSNLEVVGYANNGKELLDALQVNEVNLVLLDVNMPVMDGKKALEKIVVTHPHIKVLMLTMHDSALQIEKLMKAGAHGYLLKNTGKEELTSAIAALMNNQSYYSQEVSQKVMEGMMRKQQQSNTVNTVELTPREKEVLVEIANELTTTEIAEKLCISHHTVESHRKNLISKLQVRGATGLVKYAILNGLVD